MKIAIIGAGAMGCLFAAKLAMAGNKILLVDHEAKTVSAIRKNGVRIREGSRQRTVRVPIEKPGGELGNYDLILVMVKAYDTKVVARELRGRVGIDSVVLTLQNGLGNVETLSNAFGKRVLAGSTTEASLRLEPGAVEHTGTGRTLVGEPDGGNSRRVTEVVHLLKGAGLVSMATSHVKSVIWSKAVLNSAINPVSALTRLHNGRLVHVSGLRELMLAVLEEGVKVARAEGVRLNLSYLTSLLSTVLNATGKNRSSMLQDVLSGRKTEIRELNGAIASIGRSRRIACPMNNAMLSLIKGLEGSSG